MTEVALDTATPHAPSVIRLLLEKLGVAYREVPEHPHLSAASRVQAILLDDEIGALMVLFPQSQLLDLSRLAELTAVLAAGGGQQHVHLGVEGLLRRRPGRRGPTADQRPAPSGARGRRRRCARDRRRGPGPACRWWSAG